MNNYQGDHLDTEGYPTEDFLIWVQEYNDLQNIGVLIDDIYTAWWTPDFGFHLKRKYKGKITLYLDTGGWSGNESIIHAFRKNFIWAAYWKTHWTGGHYKLQFPIESWIKK